MKPQNVYFISNILAQGECYSILMIVEDWLNHIYEDACERGAKVGSVLHEAQQALKC